MKNIVYVIPGNGENCKLVRYQNLIKAVEAKGYKVVPINPDWNRPMSEHVFPVEKDAVIIGFSFGAIIAYLVAKKYPCKKVIFASVSPVHEFTMSLLMDIYSHMPKELAVISSKYIKSIRVSLKSLKTPFVTIAGEKEKMKADFLVPATEHYMSKNYINCISKLI